MKHNLFVILSGILACGSLTGCYTDTADLAPPAANQPWKPAQSVTFGTGGNTTDDHISTGSATKFELPSNIPMPSKRDEVQTDQGHVYTLAELIDLAEQNNP